MKVVLIGFMGAGKSFLGQQIASQLKVDFIDSDQWISAMNQQSVPEIFSSKGEDAFRAMEETAIQQLMAFPGSVVIALGGGAMESDKNRHELAAADYLIYLKCTARTLFSRLKDEVDSRPLLVPHKDDLHSFIEGLLSKREANYCKADIVLGERLHSAESICKLIQA